MAEIRLLPLIEADGASQMAWDEAMLQSAAEQGLAALRFYTWSEATVSLGYFQPAAARLRWPTLPWLRRATGGNALIHHHELTYALALPPGDDWQPPRLSWLCRMHHLIQAVLRDLGIHTHGVTCSEELRTDDVLCFMQQTPADLTLDRSKVVGSAQRRLRRALLQHGSILLRRSPFAPELPGILDLAPDQAEGLTPERLARVLADAFANETGWRLTLGEWSRAESDAAFQFRRDKYANPAWNGKR